MGEAKNSFICLIKGRLIETERRIMASFRVAASLVDCVALNDGTSMPLFGLGMFRSESGSGREAEVVAREALKAGYRLIDTAEYYGNEADVGTAVKSCGIPRDEIFVVTKLWDHGYDTCMRHFSDSFKKLDIGYVDLFLLHHPYQGKNLESYDAMLELKKQGLIKSVGVSNYGVQHLEGLKKAGRPAPSVNQIELHPWQRKEDIVEYCRKNGIAVMGYSPLTKGQRLEDPDVLSLSKKYGKTPGQILIRWSVQSGFITIPKTSKVSRIKENADVFDWSISNDDMQFMNSFPKWSCAWDPTQSKWDP